MKNAQKQKGFSLLEMLVALAILVIVSGTVIGGMIRMTWSQSMIMNRTQLHSSVRNATEMMQQEIGQAGRVISQPGLQFTTTITVPAGATSVVASPTLTSTSGTPTFGLYVGEQLVVDANSTYEETVTIVAITPGTGQITATFVNSHTTAPMPVLVLGGFASGIVPPTTKADGTASTVFSGIGTAATTLTAGTSDGSGPQVLKLYGDINGDGTMWYVVYTCNPKLDGTGTLKRYAVQDVNSATAITLGGSGQVLLDTVYGDSGTTCFTYSTNDTAVTINGGQVKQTFVVNVSVTLTVQTQNRDLQTRQPQRETKALLNVAPRNVFNAWELASAPSGYTRAQPMPGNVLTGKTESGTQNTPLLTATLL